MNCLAFGLFRELILWSIVSNCVKNIGCSVNGDSYVFLQGHNWLEAQSNVLPVECLLTLYRSQFFYWMVMLDQVDALGHGHCTSDRSLVQALRLPRLVCIFLLCVPAVSLVPFVAEYFGHPFSQVGTCKCMQVQILR